MKTNERQKINAKSYDIEYINNAHYGFQFQWTVSKYARERKHLNYYLRGSLHSSLVFFSLSHSFVFRMPSRNTASHSLSFRFERIR